MTAKIVKLHTKHGAILASSLDVARDFGKRHDNVLRDIEEVQESLPSDLRSMWFREDSYYDARQRSLRCFDMTRDGWVQVVRRYTTPNANEWFLAYQLKFNEMEEKLGPAGARTATLWDLSPKPQTELPLGPTTIDTRPIIHLLKDEEQGELFSDPAPQFPSIVEWRGQSCRVGIVYNSERPLASRIIPINMTPYNTLRCKNWAYHIDHALENGYPLENFRDNLPARCLLAAILRGLLGSH